MLNIKKILSFVVLIAFCVVATTGYCLSPSSSLDNLSFKYFVEKEFFPDMERKSNVGARMDIDGIEKLQYMQDLKAKYSEDLFMNLDDFDPWLQAESEYIRHDINSLFLPAENGIQPEHWAPDNILLIATQQCSAKCEHCLIFSSPRTKVYLNQNGMDNVFGGKYGNAIEDFSLSGGEIFMHPEFYDIMSKYPVHSIVTNAYWAKSKETCRKKILEFKEAIYANDKIDKSSFYFGFSLDRMHMQDKSVSLEAIANVVETLYYEVPEVKIDLMKVNLKGEENVKKLFDILEERGFDVIVKDASVITDIDVVGKDIFVIQEKGKPETAREVYIDSFPLVPVGRAALLDDNEFNYKDKDNLLRMLDKNSLKSQYLNTEDKYQYVVGPDGSVSIQNIYLVPPAPVNIGNFNDESWDKIINRVASDPVAIYSRINKLDVMFNALAKRYPDFADSLKAKAVAPQQLLYMMLLNPERRMFLNLVLLKDALENNILKIDLDNPAANALAQFVLKASEDDIFDFAQKRVAVLRDILVKKRENRPSVFDSKKTQNNNIVLLRSA